MKNFVKFVKVTGKKKSTRTRFYPNLESRICFYFPRMIAVELTALAIKMYLWQWKSMYGKYEKPLCDDRWQRFVFRADSTVS